MNLKTALFIALFFSAIAVSHQATADTEPEQVNVETNDNAGILGQAKAAERRAVAELKKQADNAKEQFKTAFHKLVASKAAAADDDTSDSDALIAKAILDAETVADEVKQGEWKSVSELKAQAKRAKDIYKNAKTGLKSKFGKADSSSSSDSSDDVKDATEGVVDKAARAAEWGLIAQLKEQYNNAKGAAKAAFKKLRKQEGTSSSSSDSSDGTVKETIKDEVKERVEDHVTEAVQETVEEGKEGLLEQARNAQRAAYQELKDGAQRAKDAFWNAYKDLKNKIRAEKGQEQQEQEQEPVVEESSTSSSDSSDSSDDSILKKARRYSEILRNRAQQVKDDAVHKVDDLRHKEHVDNDL